MRVLHVCPEDLKSSGIAGYGAGFRAGLASAGVQVDLPTAPSGPSTARAIARYCREVNAAAGEYDVIHAELGGADLHRFYAAFLAARSGRPTYVTVHDAARMVWWPFTTAAIASRPRSRDTVRRLTDRPAKALEADLLDHCRAAFTLTSRGRQEMSRFYGSAGPTYVLPYPVDAAVAGPCVDPEDRLRVGFFGFWYGGKGIEQLLNAMAVLLVEGRQIRAEIAGQPSPTLHPAAARGYQFTIERHIEQLGLKESLNVHGFVADAELRRLMRSCHAVVLPYLHAVMVPPLVGTSAAMYAALATATPVVAVNTRALAETIRDGENGLLLDPGDELALVRALRRLHDDVPLRRRLSDGASATAAGLSTRHAGFAARRVYETRV